MEVNRLAQTLTLLEKLEYKNSDIDRELSEVVINYIKVPYLRFESSERLITDVLGIEVKKVYSNIYRVERVINDLYKDIYPGDFIISPTILSKDFFEKGRDIRTSIFILKNNVYPPRIVEKMVEVNLRPEKKWLLRCGRLSYVRIEDFGKFPQINVEKDNALVLDLRCNRGGRLSEMQSAYERIYSSKIAVLKSKESGFLDFRIIDGGKKRKTYIIVDKSTCSSAEIFATMGQFFSGAVLIGTQMYGKNVICKRKKIEDMIIHIPDNVFLVDGKSVLETKPNYYIDNICEYTEKDILKMCQELEKKEDKLDEGV